MIGNVIADNRLELIDYCKSYFSYFWDEICVWIDEDGRLYWYSDNGCSCHFFGDTVTSLSELETGDREACFRAIDGFVAARLEFDPAGGSRHSRGRT